MLLAEKAQLRHHLIGALGRGRQSALQVRVLLLSPEIIVQTWRSARKSIKGLTESEVRSALRAFEPLWNELFPAEQSRIVQLLIDRVDVLTDRVDIKLRIAGVSSLIGELNGNSNGQRNAA